ncbi:MAG: ATP-binding protein [Minwuia sp.]|uniref:ATP-binding protein n=1 Tax=Minwuia sp. TaxID=2493630 RepID=UPI003A8A8FE0
MAGYRTFWIRHDEGETAEAVQIRVQQMAVIVSRAPVMFIAVAFNAILTAAIADTQDHRVFEIVWAGLLTLMSALAFIRWQTRKKSETPTYVSKRGPRRLARISVVQGLIWGCGAAWLMPAGASPEQAIIGLIIAAMGAGGAMVLATVPTASIGFTIGCVLPLTVRYITVGDPLYYMLAAISVVYITVLLVMARSVYASFVDMIRARVANDELLTDLSEARTNLMDAIESTSEGFAQFDGDGRLQVANSRFRIMLGLDPEDVTPGETFESLLRQGMTPADYLDDMVGYERWIRTTVADQKLRYASDIVRMQDGRWIALHHAPTRQGGVVSLILDVTELKDRETRLNDALIRAESADRAKSEFLALMSHELRTPLNSILGFSELFMVEGFGPHSDERYKRHAGDIHESGTQLLQIINELLDLSKVQAGQFELQEETVDVSAPVGSAVRMMLERATLKGIALKVELPPDLPELFADKRVMKQMLINLIGNAVKFTRHKDDVIVRGGIDDEGGVTLSVIDRGIGVAPEDIPKILRPFGQVESSLNRAEQQGTGLGLALVKQMIELHGGRLEFRSALGRGSTVTLHFPPERTLRAAAE